MVLWTTKSKLTKACVLATRLSVPCLIAAALTTHAATVRVAALLERTMTTDGERFGGCMVALDRDLADAGLNCPGRWVTFSCTGEMSTKDRGTAMFASAQTAFLHGLQVYVHVTDEKKQNGHCYASRIDVRKPAMRSSTADQKRNSRRIPVVGSRGQVQ